MTLTATTILLRAPNASFEVVAGEAILIDINSGTYFSLNKVGTEFWQALDGKQTIADHARSIADQYSVDQAMVVGDLLEIAQAMAADNLVEAVN